MEKNKMEKYKIIVKIGKRFTMATFTNGKTAEIAYNGMVSQYVAMTATREYCGEMPHVILANMNTETIIQECIVTDGTIFEQ